MGRIVVWRSFGPSSLTNDSSGSVLRLSRLVNFRVWLTVHFCMGIGSWDLLSYSFLHGCWYLRFIERSAGYLDKYSPDRSSEAMIVSKQSSHVPLHFLGLKLDFIFGFYWLSRRLSDELSDNTSKHLSVKRETGYDPGLVDVGIYESISFVPVPTWIYITN